MRKYARPAAILALAAAPFVWVLPASAVDAPAGETLSVVSVTIPVGGREGRHSHPGPLIVQVQSGAISLDYEGKPTVTYKAGDTFFVEAGKIHEGVNRGS